MCLLLFDLPVTSNSFPFFFPTFEIDPLSGSLYHIWVSYIYIYLFIYLLMYKLFEGGSELWADIGQCSAIQSPLLYLKSIRIAVATFASKLYRIL